MLLFSSGSISYLGMVIDFFQSMTKRFLFLILILLLSGQVRSQLNQYKYLVVPVKFDGFKQQNEHKTSTMTKFCLVREGFNVVYDDNLPEDIRQNRCLGLYVDLKDNSSMFTTKVNFVFKDCDGNEIFKTIEGRSKAKDFVKAYKEAIEEAILPLKKLNYTYEGKNAVTESSGNTVQETVTVNMGNDVKKIVERPQEEYVVEDKATEEEQVYDTVAISETTIKNNRENISEPNENSEPQTLYAQEIDNGYQLVDTTPKVVYKLTKTALENTYLVEGIDSGNGLLYKKEEKWILEYNSKNGKTVRELVIKF